MPDSPTTMSHDPFGPGDALADLCAESVIVFGLDGSIRAWSAGAVRLYGWAADQALGQDIDALLAAPAHAPHPLAKARVLANGAWSGRLQRRAADGQEHVVQVRWAPRPGAQGRSDAIIEFSAALERDEAFARFTVGEARYRQMFLRAPVALMLADGSGVSRLARELRAAGVADPAAYVEAHPDYLDQALDVVAVAEVNEQAIRLFGAREASELIKPVRHFWPDSPDTFKRALIARFEGKPYFAEETRMRTLDGRTLDILFSLAFPPPDVFDGEALMGLLDITDRRKAESQLKTLQADFAHAARVSTLGELTASLAHELTQPLAAIAANGQAALRWLDKAQPNIARAKERADRIVHDANRAAEIIQGIRGLATNRAPENRALAVNDLVREVLLILKHDLDEKGVRVTCALAPDLPLVIGDRVQLQQVVVNLIINSLQAIVQAESQDRAIHLRTSIEGHGRVGFSIRDSGPGVPLENLDRVFSGFFSTKPDGMGMGLAICHSIIVAHGGEIVAANAPEGGACFRFTLPTQGGVPGAS
jgi:two-component system sensor kinase FixL